MKSYRRDSSANRSNPVFRLAVWNGKRTEREPRRSGLGPGQLESRNAGRPFCRTRKVRRRGQILDESLGGPLRKFVRFFFRLRQCNARVREQNNEPRGNGEQEEPGGLRPCCLRN